MDKDVAMNCFGFQNFNERYSCKALKIMRCDGCSFYKTREQVRLEQERTERRLKEIAYVRKTDVEDEEWLQMKL